MSELAITLDNPAQKQDGAELLLRGAGLFYLATLVGIAGRVGVTFIIAHALGASALGAYTLAFATVQALTMLATNGQDTGLVRFVSPAHQHQNRPELRALLESALLMGLLFSLIASVAMVVVFPRVAPTIPDAPLLGIVFALAIVPGVLATMVGSYGLACGRNIARAIPNNIVGILVQVVFTLIALQLGWGLWGIALGFVSNNVAALLASVFLVRDLYPRRVISASRRAAARTLFGYSWKLGLSNVTNYVLLNAALFVLGYLNATQAGLYSAASRLTFPGLIFFESFGAVFGPHAARKLNDASLQQDLQRVTNWMIVSSAPIFILLFVFADTWMNLLGAEFAVGASVLRLMALAQMVNMLTGAASVMVTIANRPGLKAVNTLTAWGLNLVLVLVLAPQFGAFGAAVAYLSAVVVIDILEYSESRFLVKLSPFGVSLIKPILLIVGFTVGLALVAQWIVLPLWSVIGLALAFVISYIVLMLRVALPTADMQAVRGLFKELRVGVLR